MSINSVVNDTVTGESVVNALKPKPPTISGYSISGFDDTALDPAGGQTVQINGTGFLAGATITFDGSAVAVVTYVNPNQLTFTSPAKSAGTAAQRRANTGGNLRPRTENAARSRRVADGRQPDRHRHRHGASESTGAQRRGPAVPQSVRQCAHAGGCA